MERLETELETVHELLDSLTERMADPATYQNGNAIQDLQKQFQQGQQKVEELSRDWEDLVSQLDELEQRFATG